MTNPSPILNTSIHVLPEWQMNDHDTITHDCLCNPKLEIQPNGSFVVVHNVIKDC